MPTRSHSLLVILTLTLLLPVCLPVGAVGTGLPAVRDRIEIDAGYEPSTETLSGCMVWHLADRGVPIPDLRLQLYPNLRCDATTPTCVLTVDSIHVGADDLSDVMKVDGVHLYVPLERSLGTDGEVHLWFRTELAEGDYRTQVVDSTAAFEAWCPLPAPWIDGAWHKVAYTAFLEPTLDLCDFEVTISYPDTLQLVAPGICKTESEGGLVRNTLRLEAASMPPMVIGRGFEVDSSLVDATHLLVYYKPKHAYVVDTVREAAAAALRYLSELVGPYPYNEHIIVVGALGGSGGLELPRMTFTSAPPPSLWTKWYRNMVVHEIAHQWFYGLFNSYQGIWPWMDESLAEYFTYRIPEHIGPRHADMLSVWGITMTQLGYSRLTARSVWDVMPVGLRGDAFFDRSTYFRTSYSKGTLVMATLFGLMDSTGERAFWREYSGQHLQTVVSPEDFLSLADKYLPHSDRCDAARLLALTAPPDFQVVSLFSRELPQMTELDSSESADAPGFTETLSVEEVAMVDTIAETLVVAVDDVADSATVETDEPLPVYQTVVDYTCRHTLGWPVDFRVQFYDGTVWDTSFVPQDGPGRLIVPGSRPALSAEIDPRFVYAIDVNRLNNSVTDRQARGTGLRLFSGITFLVESLFSALWGM